MVQTKEDRMFEFFRFVEENDISVSKLMKYRDGLGSEIDRIRGMLILFERTSGPIPENYMDISEHGILFVPVHIDWQDTVNPLMFFYQDPTRDSGSMYNYVRTAKTFEDLRRYLASWVSVLLMVKKHVEYAVTELEERMEYKPSALNVFFLVTIAGAIAGLLMFVVNYLNR